MKKILLSTILLFSVFLMSTVNVSAQQSWGGGGGLWTSAGWSNSGIAPYDQAYAPGSAVIFNVAGTIGGTSGISFTSIATTENVELVNFTTNLMNTTGIVAPINVGAGKTLDLSKQPMSTATGTGIIKNGLGTLAWVGGNFTSGFTLNAGTVVARGTGAFGNALLTINGGTIVGVSGLQAFTAKPINIAISDDFTFGVDVDVAGGALSTKDLTFGAAVSLGTSNRTITLRGTGINTFSGVISSTGGGLTTGAGSTGFLSLSGANTYTGPTTISGGTLTLGASDVVPNESPVIFNGGTLKTGAFNEIYSTVNLSDNSTISLNNSDQSHNFAASNAIGWTSGKTLTVTGWTGGYNSTSGTNGKIFVGNSTAGLTPSQLLQIKFVNSSSVTYDATILSTGEVVPSAITVLPITLASFTAKAVDKTILLNWKTASEKNNQKFEILRSGDDKTFKVIGTVNGAENSDSEENYSFVDENPYAGTNYYQLKQTDNDGTSTLSNVISAVSKVDVVTITAFAASNSVIVGVNSPNRTGAELTLFDLGGTKLSSKAIVLNTGYNEVVINKALAPGVYFVNLVIAGKSTSLKFIK